MEFQVRPVRIQFEAHDDLSLSPEKEINAFRGAFGLSLREVCCGSACPGARSCPRAAQCAYASMFEPRWNGGPSGYHDAPRPFVLRSCGPLALRLHLFDTGAAPLEPLEKAFRAIAHAGIGPGRAKAALRAFEPQPIRRLPLRGTPAEGRLVVRFVTPTELKGRGAVRLEPAFPLLMERLVERVWILGRFYQHWPAWDRDILLREAARVQLVNWQWRYEHRQRRSSRTGQTHPLGGFMGTATYEGPLGIFVPLLEIGRWTGVGRQTVWGKGEIQVEPPQPYLFSRESAGQRSSQSPVLATVRPAPDAASG